MRKIPTVSLEQVKTMLRRGGAGTVENHSGWCVFVDLAGKHFYVMDDEDSKPVPYHRISPINRARLPQGSAHLILGSDA